MLLLEMIEYDLVELSDLDSDIKEQNWPTCRTLYSMCVKPGPDALGKFVHELHVHFRVIFKDTN